MSEDHIRYACLTASLQPSFSETDLVGAIISNFPLQIEHEMISENILTTQDAFASLGKVEAIEKTRVGFRGTPSFH